MTRARTRIARLATAVVFVLPLALGSFTAASSAAPSKAEVEAAQAKAQQLGHDLELVIEQYNEAKYQLELVQTKLAQTLKAKQQAEALSSAATTRLAARAVEAYTGMGSQVDVLLGAQDLSEFSDRLEFMGSIAQNDADLATAADTARQQAEWAAQQYDTQLRAKQGKLDDMAAKRGDIEKMLQQQQQLYETLNKDYQDYLAAQEAAAQAAANDETNAAGDPGTGGTGGTTGGGGGGGFVPPPNATGAQIAIAAAQSVLGVQYVWGSADPSVGFDCSGLTMWAWAQAGVSIPHSSASQYSSYPHVPISDMQPGDLLFFYSPISHVALYIGGGMMIHARHPGPGGQVQLGSVAGYGEPVIGVSRPG
ncbi:MAG: C40 family peptidase [Actinomycetota bacterium]